MHYNITLIKVVKNIIKNDSTKKYFIHDEQNFCNIKI